jgi:tetratricopeptide (TPR) repeat protein
MQLKIKPASQNKYPLAAILIKNPSVLVWLQALQHMNWAWETLEIYPIPDTIPNSVWGCMVIPLGKWDKVEVGKHELCQRVHPHLYIPEKSLLQPCLLAEEITTLFSQHIHIFHPEFGLVELENRLNISELLAAPTHHKRLINKPLASIFIPKYVHSFQIKPVPPEEVLRLLEEKAFPQKETMPDEPLSLLEKGKLAFYRQLFTQKKDANGKVSIEKTSFWEEFVAKMGAMFSKNPEWAENMMQDFADLERRNQNEVEKLMEMLKNNPEEALKYAIPLNDTGASRGELDGAFNMSKRWGDFSLFGNMSSSGSGGGGGINLGDSFYKLQQQYNETAKALIREKNYLKAAFVYMKLLKNHQQAAITLEEGYLYQEAATVYLKNCNNKLKAAQCYEKGNMVNDAIQLYKELNENEKVGDLYVQIYKRKEANEYYEKVANSYKANQQYVKAALIYRNKIEDEIQGQEMLLEGWRSSKDSFNCLNNYFENIREQKELKKEIHRIYDKEVGAYNRETFLQVMTYEFQKNNELAEDIKEIAYEIIAAQAAINPAIVAELRKFNPKDKELTKDTIRFGLGKR